MNKTVGGIGICVVEEEIMQMVDGFVGDGHGWFVIYSAASLREGFAIQQSPCHHAKISISHSVAFPPAIKSVMKTIAFSIVEWPTQKLCRKLFVFVCE
jgi:hypothetical protein